MYSSRNTPEEQTKITLIVDCLVYGSIREIPLQCTDIQRSHHCSKKTKEKL
jgi:hypothetical protein